MSIIGEKYTDRYKEKDWLGQFIDTQAAVPRTREKKIVEKDEAGNEVERTEVVETGKTRMDLDQLFQLARANHIDPSAMEAQRGRPGAPGRIRMTLGNSLRAAARHRHGLFTMEGEWVDAPADWVGDNPRTQERDGSKIAAPAQVEADV